MLLISQNSNLTNRVDANTLGNAVDLIGYTSSSNPYTFPNDGYLYITCDSPVGTNVKAYFRQGSNDMFGLGCAGDGASYGRNAIFVKKGMKVYISYEGSGFHTAMYRPLS